MTDLDDVRSLRATDASDMLGVVARLPLDARAGYDAGLAVDPVPIVDGIAAVTYAGMGGSAVAGDILRSLFRDRLGVPVEVNRGPQLPAYCGPTTLLIASSYSGNTAETLAAFDEAIERGCRVMALTSGGQLGHRASQLGLPVVHVPGGYMPRAALGHLAFGLLGALEAAGLLPRLAADVDEAVYEMARLITELAPEVPTTANPAKTIAATLGERAAVIWGAEGFAAVAAQRWRTQWNENAKLPAFAAAMPELDHNEVVGWSRGTGKHFGVVALRHDGEHEDIAARFAASLEIPADAGAEIVEVRASGRAPLAQLCSLIVLGDLSATYTGLLRGVDPSPIEAIDRLKAAIGGGPA